MKMNLMMIHGSKSTKDLVVLSQAFFPKRVAPKNSHWTWLKNCIYIYRYTYV